LYGAEYLYYGGASELGDKWWEEIVDVYEKAKEAKEAKEAKKIKKRPVIIDDDDEPKPAKVIPYIKDIQSKKLKSKLLENYGGLAQNYDSTYIKHNGKIEIGIIVNDLIKFLEQKKDKLLHSDKVGIGSNPEDVRETHEYFKKLFKYIHDKTIETSTKKSYILSDDWDAIFKDSR
jgi:hypothetical protein